MAAVLGGVVLLVGASAAWMALVPRGALGGQDLVEDARGPCEAGPVPDALPVVDATCTQTHDCDQPKHAIVRTGATKGGGDRHTSEPSHLQTVTPPNHQTSKPSTSEPSHLRTVTVPHPHACRLAAHQRSTVSFHDTCASRRFGAGPSMTTKQSSSALATIKSCCAA